MKVELTAEQITAFKRDMKGLEATLRQAVKVIRDGHHRRDIVAQLEGFTQMQWPAARELMVAINDADKPQKVKGMQIKTKTIAPTPTEPAQIKVTAEDGRSIVIPWDYGVEDMHRHAAETLNDDKPVRFLWDTPDGCEFTTDRGIGRY